MTGFEKTDQDMSQLTFREISTDLNFKHRSRRDSLMLDCSCSARYAYMLAHTRMGRPIRVCLLSHTSISQLAA